MSAHRWSGWPGAYCLDCGSESAIESAIQCPACYVPCCDEEEERDPVTRLCPQHDLWSRALATCPADQDLAREYNATYGEVIT